MLNSKILVKVAEFDFKIFLFARKVRVRKLYYVRENQQRDNTYLYTKIRNSSQFLLLFLVCLHKLTQASSDRYEVDRGHHSDRSQDEAQWDLGCTLRSTIESIIDSGVFSPHPHCKSVQQTELSRHLK